MSTADTLRVRVAAKTREAQDICTFELVPVVGDVLPAFTAGSHIDVHIREGLTRQYSLCNAPNETHRYVIGVLRDAASRGGSVAMHDGVNVGDLLTISSPKNHFELIQDARQSILLAGGIGVTPLLCMAEKLSAQGASFEMHYCSRSRARTAFVERIQSSPFQGHVQFHFDDGAAEQKIDFKTVLATRDSGKHLYVCGPKGFMDVVLDFARTTGWPEAQLHYEFFAAEVQCLETDGSFEVQVSGSEKIVVVAKDQTVVQALVAAGFDVPTACEQGVCGTCLTRVVSGIPDHRDQYLTPAEHAANDQFLPCCSRAQSARLVIAL
jgi:vanillate O-demethylase ferredoxin subunit